MFKSKTEAYLYTLTYLTKINKLNSFDIFSKEIEEIKILMENHEQSPEKISTILENALNNPLQLIFLTDQQIIRIKKISDSLTNNKYSQTNEEKFNNPLGRLFESQIQIELLTDPTQAMLDAVKNISMEILKHLELEDMLEKLDLNLSNNKKINHFLNSLQKSFPISFGAFQFTPSLEEIKQILIDNKKDNFIEIMFIHFLFSQMMLKNITINNDILSTPVGKMLEIIKNYPKNGTFPYSEEPANFFNDLDSEKLSYIPDTLFSNSMLYNVGKNRGRANELTEGSSNKMGLLKNDQELYSEGLPTHPSYWGADAKFQEADLNSPYVKDLIYNDAIYVSGPSGMTALLLGQMECLANFPTIIQKQHYLSAVAAYIVGGGFHSLHEVIGPAEHALNLVPGYNVQIPQENELAPPPNYHVYYEQQINIDPRFSIRREAAWNKLISFASNFFSYYDNFRSHNVKRPLPNQGIHNLKNQQSLSFFKAKVKKKKRDASINKDNHKLKKTRCIAVSDISDEIFESGSVENNIKLTLCSNY